MTIANGTQLGPYEIVAPLGAGGMGEVYRAKDSRLDREVAIKVLPDLFSRDPERVARFQREAKVLASLNHPNIAAIYGFETVASPAVHKPSVGQAVGRASPAGAPTSGDEGRRAKPALHFLVLELVEGETLAERLRGAALPVDEALEVCKQIAEALEAAHDSGVIHRDLKPANVKITPGGKVKVLDFGLAKAFATDDSSQSEIANSPTITANFTRAGTILGTAAYMSPEQARGKPLDKRTDIWSFGCVLYESLGGRMPFEGETSTDLIAKILERDPNWDTLPADTPPTVQLLLRRCLAKDRNKRLRDIGDARIELENAIADPMSSSLTLAGAALTAAARPGRRRAWLRKVHWALSGVLAIALVFTALGLWRATRPVLRLPLHLNVEVSPNEPIRVVEGAQAVLSPDGTRLVFGAGSGAGAKLYVRRLDQSEAAPLSGTQGANHPFFSPDGEWIGFFADTKLKKVSVSGGAPISLCDVRIDNRGGTWSRDGTIIFVPNTTTGLWRVQEAGGTPQELTTLNKEKNERSHRWPQILPGGRAVLFTSQTTGTDFNDANIEVLSLDTGERKILHHGGSYGRYLSSGHIVFVRESTLFAATYDIKGIEMTATPAPILEGVTSDSRNGGAQFAFSETGTLVYSQGSQVSENSSLLWVDREGKTTPLLETIRTYAAPRLSPDAKRLAMQIIHSSDESDIWVYDIERGALTRLTFDAAGDWVPVWSPDGNRVAFASDRDSGNPNLYWKLADGSGETERLTTSENVQIPCDWSPDGKRLAYIELGDETRWDIWVLELDGDRGSELFLGTPFSEGSAVFSPDGQWLAYGSNESGEIEVYVRPFPNTGGKWQVSTGGGEFPVWSPDGKKLFYRNGDAVLVVSVTTEGSSFRAEKPEQLFELESGGIPFLKSYDIAPDGQRFVWLKREEAVEKKDQVHLRFIFNWFDEVEAKVPTDRN